MTGATIANFQNRNDNLTFMSLYIYNIKKSLSIMYTEENPSQGVSPRQFDDVQNLFSAERENFRISRL